MRTIYPHTDEMKSPLFIMFAVFGLSFLSASLSISVLAETAKLLRRAYVRSSTVTPGAMTAAVAVLAISSIAQYYWMSI